MGDEATKAIKLLHNKMERDTFSKIAEVMHNLT
jgi:hypothetical protein